MILALSGTGFASQSGNGESLRSDARVEVGKAVAAVAEASRKGALWIPAQRALADAKTALEQGNDREAIAHAQLARRFAELGIHQLDSAPYQYLPD